VTRPLEHVNKNMREKCFSVAVAVSLNVFLSVLVVILNKHIYTQYRVPNVSLTCFHFAVTAAGVYTCERIGVFHRKSLPIADVLRLSLIFCAFVVFTNLALQTNSVGTYLVFKMAATPAVIAVEAFWSGRKFSHSVLSVLVSH